MTTWLQDKPVELCDRLRKLQQADLREIGNADEARAVMNAAQMMIRREILNEPENNWYYSQRQRPLSPLHWSWRDRLNDALACIGGTARVLRRVENGL